MSRLRAIVAGAGGRGRWFVGSLVKREDTEIVALCDTVIEKAENAARKCGVPDVRCFRTIEEALQNVDCDVVMVAVTDSHHAEIVVPAVEKGKAVYCEKPLETTLDKCRTIVEADQRAGGKTFVGFNLRYAPVYVVVREQIDSGAVGRILTIQLDEFYNGGRTYFRRWNRLRSEGGGLWITKASHDFDLMAWFAGTEPLHVSAFCAKTYYVPKPEAAMQCRECRLAETCPDCVGSFKKIKPGALLTEKSGGPPRDLCLYNSDSDTFDHGVASVRFDKDIFATYTCNVVCGFSDRRFRVSGTKGTLEGSLQASKIRLIRRDPSETIEIPAGGRKDLHGGGDETIQDSFFAFVQGRAEPKCRPREAATAIRMGLAATLSSDEHRVVSLDEFKL